MHERLQPILPGFHPDPTICRHGDLYFLTTSSMEYFPGCPLFMSEDLTRWRQIGHILNRPSQLPLAQAQISGGIFAPTLRSHGGRLYCVTTNQTSYRPEGRRNFIVWTEDPFGSWSEPVWVDGMYGIDPDLFWDLDGRCYAHWSWKYIGRPPKHICIGQAEIDVEKGVLLEEPRRIWAGTGGLGPEGPHMFYRNGWYYLCIAEGGTEYGHMQTLARSRTLRGPFEACPTNPVLTHRSLATAVHGVGHCDLVEGPDDQWFGVCHGFRPRGYHKFHVLGRETFAFPVRWRDDGWPEFGEDGKLPATAPVSTQPADFTDDLESADWPSEWTWLRNPIARNYERPGQGAVTLTGADSLTALPGSPTWLGLRQCDHDCLFTVVGEAEIGDGGEAGIGVFQNCQYHALFGWRLVDGRKRLYTRLVINEIVVEETLACPANQGMALAIRATGLRYEFGLSDGMTFQALKGFDARLFSTEFGGRFSGVFLILYAIGDARLISRRVSCDQQRAG